MEWHFVILLFWHRKVFFTRVFFLKESFQLNVQYNICEAFRCHSTLVKQSSLLLTGKSLSILNPKTMICEMRMAYDKHDIDNWLFVASTFVPRSWLVPGPSHAQSLHCPGQAGRASSIRWLLTHHWFSEFSELSCLEEDFLRSIFSFDFSEATAKQHAENLYWCRQSLTNILSDQQYNCTVVRPKG